MTTRNWQNLEPLDADFSEVGNAVEGEYVGNQAFTFRTGNHALRHIVKDADGQEWAFNGTATLQYPMSRVLVGDYILVTRTNDIKTPNGIAKGFSVMIDADIRKRVLARRELPNSPIGENVVV